MSASLVIAYQRDATQGTPAEQTRRMVQALEARQLAVGTKASPGATAAFWATESLGRLLRSPEAGVIPLQLPPRQPTSPQLRQLLDVVSSAAIPLMWHCPGTALPVLLDLQIEQLPIRVLVASMAPSDAATMLEAAATAAELRRRGIENVILAAHDGSAVAFTGSGAWQALPPPGSQNPTISIARLIAQLARGIVEGTVVWPELLAEAVLATVGIESSAATTAGVAIVPVEADPGITVRTPNPGLVAREEAMARRWIEEGGFSEAIAILTGLAAGEPGHPDHDLNLNYRVWALNCAIALSLALGQPDLAHRLYLEGGLALRPFWGQYHLDRSPEGLMKDLGIWPASELAKEWIATKRLGTHAMRAALGGAAPLVTRPYLQMPLRNALEIY